MSRPRHYDAIRSRLCCSLLVAAMIAAALQSWGQPQQFFRASRPAMGTTFSIYLYAASAEQANEEFEVAFENLPARTNKPGA